MMVLYVISESLLGRVCNVFDIIPIIRGATAIAARTSDYPMFTPDVFEWKLSPAPYENYIDGKRAIRASIICYHLLNNMIFWRFYDKKTRYLFVLKNRRNRTSPVQIFGWRTVLLDI